MSRRAGFTLLEVCLVIFITLLIMSLAIPSVQGLFEEQHRLRSFAEFDAFVRRAQTRAVQERRAIVLIWDGSGITMEPDDPTPEDAVNEADHFAFTDGRFALERPAALEKDPPVEWLFWRSGTCEPAIIHYAGEAGNWSVSYDPLTLRTEFLDPAAK